MIMIAVVTMAAAMFACKNQPPAEQAAPAVEQAAPAAQNAPAEAEKAPEAAGKEAATAGTAPAEAGTATAPAKAENAAAEEPADDDPDDEGGSGAAGANVDKDKLAKCYEEVYCAQKKGEMEKILDIYKNYGFAKPSDFTATWIEAAKDTGWVTKIAHEVSAKCK